MTVPHPFLFDHAQLTPLTQDLSLFASIKNVEVGNG
jgi:hypothetical protein